MAARPGLLCSANSHVLQSPQAPSRPPPSSSQSTLPQQQQVASHGCGGSSRGPTRFWGKDSEGAAAASQACIIRQPHEPCGNWWNPAVHGADGAVSSACHSAQPWPRDWPARSGRTAVSWGGPVPAESALLRPPGRRCTAPSHTAGQRRAAWCCWSCSGAAWSLPRPELRPPGRLYGGPACQLALQAPFYSRCECAAGAASLCVQVSAGRWARAGAGRQGQGLLCRKVPCCAWLESLAPRQDIYFHQLEKAPCEHLPGFWLESGQHDKAVSQLGAAWTPASGMAQAASRGGLLRILRLKHRLDQGSERSPTEQPC